VKSRPGLIILLKITGAEAVKSRPGLIIPLETTGVEAVKSRPGLIIPREPLGVNNTVENHRGRSREKPFEVNNIEGTA
jgi:hypothetical protein